MNIIHFPNISRRRFYLVIFFLFLWVFLIIPRKGQGQFISQDTTEYRFWYSGFNARSSALADANIAEPFGLNGLYSNPATLVFSNSKPSLVNNSLYNSTRNVLLENVTASLNHTRDHRLVGGATIHSTLMNNDPVLNPNQPQFSQIDLALGYAWYLTPSLSAGVRVNSLYGKTTNSRVWTYNASLGFLYAPSSLVSYGLVYKGTGLHNGWLGSEPVYHFSDPDETTVYSMQAPHRVELGVTLRFPSLVKYPDFVLSFSNEKIFGMDGLVYKGGLEVNVRDFLALRGGYLWSPYSRGGRLGAGFLFDTFRLDYAFVPASVDLNGKSHQLSISLDI